MTANNTEHGPYHRAISFPGAQSLPVLYVDGIHLSLLWERRGAKWFEAWCLDTWGKGAENRGIISRSFCEMWKKLLAHFCQKTSPIVSISSSCWAFVIFCSVLSTFLFLFWCCYPASFPFPDRKDCFPLHGPAEQQGMLKILMMWKWFGTLHVSSNKHVIQ